MIINDLMKFDLLLQKDSKGNGVLKLYSHILILQIIFLIFFHMQEWACTFTSSSIEIRILKKIGQNKNAFFFPADKFVCTAIFEIILLYM